MQFVQLVALVEAHRLLIDGIGIACQHGGGERIRGDVYEDLRRQRDGAVARFVEGGERLHEDLRPFKELHQTGGRAHLFFIDGLHGFLHGFYCDAARQLCRDGVVHRAHFVAAEIGNDLARIGVDVRRGVEFDGFVLNDCHAVGEQLVDHALNGGLLADGVAPFGGAVVRGEEGRSHREHLFQLFVVHDFSVCRRLTPDAVVAGVDDTHEIGLDSFARIILFICGDEVGDRQPFDNFIRSGVLIDGDDHAFGDHVDGEVKLLPFFVHIFAVNDLCVFGIAEGEVLIGHVADRKVVPFRIAEMDDLVCPAVVHIHIRHGSIALDGIRLFGVRVEHDERIARPAPVVPAAVRTEIHVRGNEISVVRRRPAVTERRVHDLILIADARIRHRLLQAGALFVERSLHLVLRDARNVGAVVQEAVIEYITLRSGSRHRPEREPDRQQRSRRECKDRSEQTLFADCFHQKVLLFFL